MNHHSTRLAALSALGFLCAISTAVMGADPTVTEAHRLSPKYRAFTAWQHRAVVRSSVGGNHDTLAEYANRCDRATGIKVPAFSCGNGVDVPGQGTVPATTRDATHCDRPNVLNGHCDPGSRFQVLPGRTEDAVAVAHCRKVGLPIDGDEYNDIAVIQFNKKNGALCFYQALTNLPGANIPAPILGDEAKWQDGQLHWETPEGTEAIGCAGCHDNGGFIRSEYLAQLKTPPNALPNREDGFNNLDTPLRYVGLDYKTNRSWSITAPAAAGDAERACNSCHRLAVPNRMAFGIINGTGAHFAAVATARTQFSKNEHGPTSPIWMRPTAIFYNERAEASAKIFQECARGFFNSGFSAAPPGCAFTPLGAPYVEPINPVASSLAPILDYVLN